MSLMPCVASLLNSVHAPHIGGVGGGGRYDNLAHPTGFRTAYAPDYGVHAFLDYAPAVYAEVARIKRVLRLQSRYVAVHWRSESTNCNCTACDRTAHSHERVHLPSVDSHSVIGLDEHNGAQHCDELPPLVEFKLGHRHRAHLNT